MSMDGISQRARDGGASIQNNHYYPHMKFIYAKVGANYSHDSAIVYARLANKYAPIYLHRLKLFSYCYILRVPWQKYIFNQPSN